VFLSSADWMPRNFYRRVEVMFPIEAAELKDRILHEIVPAYLLDNVKARVLQPDGSYVRMQPAPGEPPYRCQERLLSIRHTAAVPEPRPVLAGAFGGNGEDVSHATDHADGRTVHADGNGSPQENQHRAL
jgi:polyphosphate kinase-like protein